jgi:adenylate cyclase, class 2
MCVEIEAKLKVDSLPEIERKLGGLGAEFVAEQMQTDYHFDDSGASLTAADRCLRLRRESVGQSQTFSLTYKGDKEKSNFKKRQEIEIEINDADSAEKLLGALGYRKVFTIEKTRRLWRFGGCEVALDKLPLLGDFVEIEGPDDERIADVQNSLGLAHVPHVPKSYAQLMKEELDRRRV